MTHPRPRHRRWFERWSPFERTVVVVLTFAVLAMIGQYVTQRSIDARQDRDRTAASEAQRECLADRLAALHDYLDARAELADRDRVNENRDDIVDNRVLRSFAEAGRTGDPGPALRALAAWEEAQKDIAATEEQINRDRLEKPLPEFPAGSCSDEPATRPGTVPPSTSGPSPSTTPKVGVGETRAPQNTPPAPQNRRYAPSQPSPVPSGPRPTSADPLTIPIPGLLSIKVDRHGLTIEPAPGGLLDRR